MSETTGPIADLKRLYAQKQNIMAWFREAGGTSQNSQEAILISYDLQAGSYLEALKEPAYRKRHDAYAGEIAGLVAESSPTSILEAGIGEATTLCSVLSSLDPPPVLTAGFDIAWSRVECARRHANACGHPGLKLSTGDMSAIPFPDNSFDVVYTAHAMEPNSGREQEILLELYRVARQRVVLCEPSYELGGEATKQRIEQHGYCSGLPSIAKDLGMKVVLHRLLNNLMRPDNATAALVIEKSPPMPQASEANFGCPGCLARMREIKRHWFCEACSMVYPVVDGIPCLLRGNGILAMGFSEDS